MWNFAFDLFSSFSNFFLIVVKSLSREALYLSLPWTCFEWASDAAADTLISDSLSVSKDFLFFQIDSGLYILNFMCHNLVFYDYCLKLYAFYISGISYK